jgi:hypothetical protein
MLRLEPAMIGMATGGRRTLGDAVLGGRIGFHDESK